MNKEEITEKAQELTIKNVTDGKNKYFSWGFYKGCVVGLEYNNKQITELEEKINVLLSCKNCPENKGGYICAKEYENKCLAQKVEFIKELEKENAVLKKRNIKDCKNFNRAVEKISEQLQYQLTKAKELLSWWVNHCGNHDLFYAEKTEKFLNSEVKKMTEEEKQRGLELQSYIDSIRDMTIKEIAIKHLKKHHLPKFLAGLLVKFSAPLLMAKDYELSELEKENAELKKKNLNTQDAVTMQMYTNKANKEIADRQLTKAKGIMNIAIEGIKHWGIVGGTERPFEKQAEMLFNLFLDKAERFIKDSEVEK